MIPYDILKTLLINGVRVMYESYNHKNAVEEFKEISKAKHPISMFISNERYDCWDIPDEIKQKHIVWRNGRVKTIELDKNGKMWRFKIGVKYFKTYYLDDFGITAKPLIFKSDDQWGLIDNGLAIEETI